VEVKHSDIDRPALVSSWSLTELQVDLCSEDRGSEYRPATASTGPRPSILVLLVRELFQGTKVNDVVQEVSSIGFGKRLDRMLTETVRQDVKEIFPHDVLRKRSDREISK
jgi:hypothetical protein